MTLLEQIASKAESIVGDLLQTDYQHAEHIDLSARVYDCDCNGFVGFVLETVAPLHYQMIPPEPTQPRPRAFKYYEFFASLAPGSAEGWRRIDVLADTRRGDIIAWRLPLIESDQNTGHVLFVAETPTVNASGIFSVTVYDSAAKPHFNDTRGNGPGQFPNGVGKGIIKFMVDGAGRATAFLFAPPDTAAFTYLQIAIGRAEPL
jgi:hypothetical protein